MFSFVIGDKTEDGGEGGVEEVGQEEMQKHSAAGP